MSLRNKRQPAPKPTISAPNLGAPHCPHCTYVGYAGPDSTPYVVCGGDVSKHQRAPVGAP